jgi:hypothetical protein
VAAWEGASCVPAGWVWSGLGEPVSAVVAMVQI